jgi:hypothetical protein
MGPDGGLTPGETGRLTVGRNITLTWYKRLWTDTEKRLTKDRPDLSSERALQNNKLAIV